MFHILSHLDGRHRSTRSIAEPRILLHSTRETPGLASPFHALVQADISLVRFQGVQLFEAILRQCIVPKPTPPFPE